MKIIAIIPARYESSRFPGKPLAFICRKPMIQRVYENVKRVKQLEDVYVATDDIRIYNTVKDFGGKAIMTSVSHSCGTERLVECIQLLRLSNEDIVLNIQGDEPLIKPEMVQDLVAIFENKDVYMGTLKKRIENTEEINNPNVVKVITDLNDYAIYFSRFPIPYDRDGKERIHYKHVGIYGYRTWFLKKYIQLEKSQLEEAESLEQLRVIENGYRIRVKETQWQTIGVDTPEQIKLVETQLEHKDIAEQEKM